MVDIPWPVSSAPGVKPQEGSGRLLNCYAEKAEQGARAPIIWKRCAGLRQILEIEDHIHMRGAVVLGATMIAVMENQVYAITQTDAFIATAVGTLTGTAPVTIAKNNQEGTPDIVCVTENGAFNLFVDAAPTDFVDPDLPVPNSVSFLNGYFLFTVGSGEIYATELNSVSVEDNSFTTEQGLALRRGVVFRGEFWAFGDKWTGVYRDAATSPFPLERRFTIARGICGTHAIAGWEEGWSNQLIWAGDDGVVYRMEGYTPAPISNSDVSRDIADAIRDGSGPLLEANVYMQGNNSMWRLTNPGMWTWEYNATTGNWHQRQSYNRTDHRGTATIRAFDRWIVGDRTTGILFEVDAGYYREATEALPWLMRSGPAAAFPSRLKVPRMDLDMTAAVGVASGVDPIQTDPQAHIRWSLDGGHTFGNAVNRSIGAQGNSRQGVTVHRIGTTSAKGIVVEVEVTDPVHVALSGGQLAIVQIAE